MNPIRTLIALTLLLAAPTLTQAQVDASSSSSLAKRVLTFDETFFTAFNTCDLAALETMVAPGLEFFHDLNGTERSRESFLSSVKNNVCGKFRRERVDSSIEVWPLGKEGVIYSGMHRFCHVGKTGCQGQGRFRRIVEWREGRGVISRVVSYDHRPIAP